MNLKNLSVPKKNHKKIFNYLNIKKISKIFKEFSFNLKVKENLGVAVSGGPDSLALAYLTKCYSLKNKIEVKYFIVNHKLRKESSLEAKTVKTILKRIDNTKYADQIIKNAKESVNVTINYHDILNEQYEGLGEIFDFCTKAISEETIQYLATEDNIFFTTDELVDKYNRLIETFNKTVYATKDAQKKMRKSDPSDLSRINLTDDKDQIANKIKKAKTDPLPMPSESNILSQRPEVENLLSIYSSLTNQSLEKSINEFNGKNFSEFKEKLSEIIIEKIEPISKEIKKLLKDERYLDSILLEGSQKANIIASKKIIEIKELVGF
jgi:tRNA(Ile)-lysidine synthase TilS/MesJ